MIDFLVYGKRPCEASFQVQRIVFDQNQSRQSARFNLSKRGIDGEFPKNHARY